MEVMETTSTAGPTMNDVSAGPIPFVLDPNCNATVNVTFHGPWRKKVQVLDNVGSPVATVDNCTGVACQEIPLRGRALQAQSFTLTAYCAGAPCGQPQSPLPPPLFQSGPVGSSILNPPWEQTYLLYTGVLNHPESATDTMCITIIVQVGIDPGTAAAL